MLLGYNTNGFAHHKLEDALAIIAATGYRAVGLTPDVHHLNPFEPDLPARLAEIRDILEVKKLKCVIETGARFLLDAHRKHQPTLLSPTMEERAYRYEFLALDAVSMASELGAECISFWSGTATDDAAQSVLMDRLVEQCQRLADDAARKNVKLAFEPEPGMFIDAMDKFAELHGRVNHPHFGLTLDVGHLVCLGELPIEHHITHWAPVLWNVHLDDMKAGIHDHLPFGEGELDVAEVFKALHAVSYAGIATVELSRQSHDAVRVARTTMNVLKPHLVKH